MLTRIITGVTGIAAAAVIITKGGELFSIAVIVLSIIGWYEFRQLAASKGYHVYYMTSGLPVVLITSAAGIYYVYFWGRLDVMNLFFWLLIVTIVFFLLTMLEALIHYCCCNGEKWLVNTGLSVFGMLYCGLLFSYIIILRTFDREKLVDLGFITIDYGEALLWAILLGTWASDTFAYFFGRAIGRHPFCRVSPKKTLEGAIAGFICCIIVVLILMHTFLSMSWCKAFVLALCVAVFAPLGDLVESIIKRSFDANDSGRIFPGHGGVLDRFDSLLFVAPVAYYVVMIITYSF
ncbi:MAG: phosphatidate cytidylyltransferase [Phascolarctobacterium sp.]|nr:phosphatidate cytidylyltransferase [Phascolarctobacterium sp.]